MPELVEIVTRLTDHPFWSAVLATTVGGVLVAVVTGGPRLAVERLKALLGDPQGTRALRRYLGSFPGGPNLALRILRTANRDAVGLYRHRVEGTEPTDRQVRHWEATFSEAWDGQRHFVDAPVGGGPDRDQPVVDVIIRKLQGAHPDRPCRIWLRGRAGAGKSTTLARLYFELADLDGTGGDGELPVPLYVQPRNLSGQPVLELAHPPQGTHWLETFVRVWAENRRIPIPPALISTVATELRRGLETGQIILILDGYDEFFRMDLAERALDLLENPYVVYAERQDGHRQGRSDATVLRLDPEWPISLRRKYLDRRWAHKHSDWIEPVLRVLGDPGSRWLHNPRYFVFLLELLDREASPPTIESLRSLVRGQYHLLDFAFDEALRRLHDFEKHHPQFITKGEAAERLSRVALAQYTGGDYCLAPQDMDDLWRPLLKLTELLDVEPDDDGHHLALRQELFVEFFLGPKIASAIRGRRLPPVHQPWTRLTTETTATLLSRDGPRAARELVWDRLGEQQLRDREGALERWSRRYVTQSLFILALYLEELTAEDEGGTTLIEAGHRLAGLDLAGVGAAGYRFRQCCFDGASLVGADLQGATFEHCTFRGTDLTRSDAYGTTFRDCSFLPEGGGNLLVEGMQIAEAEFPGSDVSSEGLGSRGADVLHSRYRDVWGRLFTQKQAWLLGPDYVRLEASYLSMIRAAVGDGDGQHLVYMIDLMAGGSNPRLLRLMAPELLESGTHEEDDEVGLDHLRVLAVDRDTTQLDSLALPSGRFQTWGVDLHGDADGPREGNLTHGLDFGPPLSHLDGSPRRVQLVIAKKAIHELPRRLQPALVSHIHGVLADGGRFILFADAPGSMSAAGRERLEEVRELLIRHRAARRGGSLTPVRTALLDGQEFGAGEDDVALFCNLWVMVKDWVHRNEHEVRSRYFSGRDEIVGWCDGKDRFTLAAEETGRYRLTPPRFNESGIRTVLSRLDHGTDIPEQESAHFERHLRGLEDARLQLLIDFTDRHLLTHTGGPTPLGQRLNADVESTDFGDIHDSLRKQNLPAIYATVFDFPVHVFTFEKGIG